MTDIIESPDLQQLGKQALQDLLNNLTQAKAFAVEQAPEFCQQIIARGMWLPAITCAFALLALAAALAFLFFVGRPWIKETRKGILHQDDVIVLGLGFPLFGALALAIGMFVAVYQTATQALAVYVAPKVFLVEELMRMVK